MSTRRDMRAGVPAGGDVPARLLRFDPEDWPAPDPAEEARRLDRFGPEFRAHAARWSARCRFTEAQREWAAAHGVSLSEFWRGTGAHGG